ncbi:MAG: hypothetical protein ACK55Z_13145 [bacterium]|jgi:hypothetical protein
MLSNNKKNGLLPLRSEIEYQRRLKNKGKPVFEFNKIKITQSNGEIKYFKRRK